MYTAVWIMTTVNPYGDQITLVIDIHTHTHTHIHTVFIQFFVKANFKNKQFYFACKP